jgi:hypothetical protein
VDHGLDSIHCVEENAQELVQGNNDIDNDEQGRLEDAYGLPYRRSDERKVKEECVGEN